MRERERIELKIRAENIDTRSYTTLVSVFICHTVCNVIILIIRCRNLRYLVFFRKQSLILSFVHLGDRLLPLAAAAEEESQFPTLQEVEEMSNQQIKLAHFNRALPKTDNPTWKSELAEKDDDLEQHENGEVSDGNEGEITEAENASEDVSQAVATPSYIGHQIPEDFLIKAGLVGNDDAEDEYQVQPLYKLTADGNTQRKFKFSIFH